MAFFFSVKKLLTYEKPLLYKSRDASTSPTLVL